MSMVLLGAQLLLVLCISAQGKHVETAVIYFILSLSYGYVHI
jgi:hypothetical protein